MNKSIKVRVAIYTLPPVILIALAVFFLDMNKNRLVERTLNEYMGYLKDMIFMSTFDSLKKGNMTVFQEHLIEIGKYDKVNEFSLLGPDGVVHYSSEQELVGKKTDLTGISTDRQTVFTEGDSMIFYYPVMTTEYCLRCHREWTDGTINSFYKVNLNSSSIATIRKMSVINMALLCLAGLAAGLIVMMAVNSQIFARLKRVNEVLDDLCGGEGDLTMNMEVRRLDEIGTVRTKINTFINHLRDMMEQLKSKIAEVDNEIDIIRRSIVTIDRAVQDNASHVMSISSSSEQVSATLNENINNLESLNDNVTSKRAAITESLKNVSSITKTVTAMTGT
ncbi:MAG: hypothetical protein AB7E48_11695, partial [Deferribacterales bacterium]